MGMARAGGAPNGAGPRGGADIVATGEPMTAFNPYQAPKAPLYVAPTRVELDGDCWREGSVLVVRAECKLPPRCIKCNAPAIEPIKHRRYYWHSPAWYLLILLNILIYALVAAMVRKHTRVSAGLCARHRRRRRIGLGIALASVPVGVSLMFMGVDMERGWVILAGALSLLALLIGGMSVARILTASHIGPVYTRFKGCGRDFLASLPTYVGGR